MAGRNRGHGTRRADDLKAFARLFVLVGGKFGQVLLEKPAHQGKPGRIVLHIAELVAQRRHPQWYRNPVHHPSRRKPAAARIEPRMQPHDRAWPVTLWHRGYVDPHQFGRAAANIHHQQLFGAGTDQRRAGHHRQARLFLGLDDVQGQPGLAAYLTDEFLCVAGPAASFGRHQPHPPHLAAFQLLLTDPQRLNRARHGRARQPPGPFQPGSQLDRLGKAVNHMKPTALWLGNQHAARIRTQIQRRIKGRGIGWIWRGAFDRLGKRARTFGALGRHVYALRFRVTSKIGWRKDSRKAGRVVP